MHISMLLSTGCFYFINIYCLYLYVFSSFSYSLALSCSSVLIRDHFHKGKFFFVTHTYKLTAAFLFARLTNQTEPNQLAKFDIACDFFYILV